MVNRVTDRKRITKRSTWYTKRITSLNRPSPDHPSTLITVSLPHSRSDHHQIASHHSPTTSLSLRPTAVCAVAQTRCDVSLSLRRLSLSHSASLLLPHRLSLARTSVAQPLELVSLSHSATPLSLCVATHLRIPVDGPQSRHSKWCVRRKPSRVLCQRMRHPAGAHGIRTQQRR